MRVLFVTALALMLGSSFAIAGEAEVKSAQTTIDSQLKAFQADDGAAAYGYAAPTIKQLFPSVDVFMSMVRTGYPPIHHPKSYAFGKTEELSATSIRQQVMIVGPDGKDYEASYTLELQPDGVFRITGVSLRASNTLST